MILDQAKEIFNKYPILDELPTSLSGKHHKGETHREHAEMSAKIMSNLCKNFNIPEEDIDMLMGAAYLHDIGLVLTTYKGKIESSDFKYYENTNYSRNDNLWKIHPILTSLLLDVSQIDRKEEIKKLVSVHMSKWFKDCPQPSNLYEYLMCLTDYIACFQNDLWEKEVN